MGRIVGIDLGTTNSLVAAFGDGGPRTIPVAGGDRYLPSVVGVEAHRGLVIGRAARDLAKQDCQSAILSVKRHMGTDRMFNLGGQDLRPQDISAMILRELRRAAESHFLAPIDRAVISVPAYFNEVQRRATREAGEIAGLKVERLISEPTAAALAYGLDKAQVEDLILVYDLGGGTFDVSILEMFEGIFSVRASSGDTRLGGDDFDERIFASLVEAAGRRQGSRRLLPEGFALCRLAVEAAKIRLSTDESTPIRIAGLPCADGSTLELAVDLRREQFERSCRDLLERTGQGIARALVEAGVAKERIGQVILVGGATRMPMVRRYLTELFGKPPLDAVDPMEAVALGAAIQAHLLDSGSGVEGMVVTDVSPFTLGVAVVGDHHGETRPGVFDPLIHRNASLPARCTKRFSTTHPEQDTVSIEIYQGDDPLVENNTLLDRYYLGGLPRNRAHPESVDITFEYDNDGILKVSAVVFSTGKSAGIRIDPSRMKAVGGNLIAARKKVSDLWDGSLPRRVAEEMLARLSARLEALPAAGRAELSGRLTAARAVLDRGDREEIEKLIAELRLSIGDDEARTHALE